MYPMFNFRKLSLKTISTISLTGEARVKGALMHENLNRTNLGNEHGEELHVDDDGNVGREEISARNTLMTRSNLRNNLDQLEEIVLKREVDNEIVHLCHAQNTF